VARAEHCRSLHALLAVRRRSTRRRCLQERRQPLLPTMLKMTTATTPRLQRPLVRVVVRQRHAAVCVAAPREAQLPHLLPHPLLLHLRLLSL
jgi:hypothetical protein